MDWKGIVGPLLRQFAPKLAKGLLGQIPVVGPLAVSFGGEAIDAAIGGLIAQVFGVEPTPEAVSDAIQAAPSDVAADKLAEAQRIAEVKWPALATIAVAEEETARTQIVTTAESMKQEVLATTELKESKWRTAILIMNGLWRPLFALELLAECATLFFGGMFVFLHSMINNEFADIDATIKLMPVITILVLPYLGARFGILGYHMNLRTREKEAVTDAVTDAPKPVVMDDIKAMLRASGVKVK